MTTELQQIAHRIRKRAALDESDRKRQRELLREEVGKGRKWADLLTEAQISRPTLSAALKRSD